MSVHFVSGEMIENFNKLLHHFGISETSDISNERMSELEGKVGEIIRRFTITLVDTDYTTEVGAGKYKSAILLLYLARGALSFTVGQREKKLIREYFPAELIKDALTNPETKHTTIKHLLHDGVVTVEIEGSERSLSSSFFKKDCGDGDCQKESAGIRALFFTGFFSLKRYNFW